MKEALGSSEMSVLTRATWRNIPEDAILHSHRRENLKSYINKNIRRVGGDSSCKPGQYIRCIAAYTGVIVDKLWRDILVA
jgi:hypothetical protein